MPPILQSNPILARQEPSYEYTRPHYCVCCLTLLIFRIVCILIFWEAFSINMLITYMYMSVHNKLALARSLARFALSLNHFALSLGQANIYIVKGAPQLPVTDRSPVGSSGSACPPACGTTVQCKELSLSLASLSLVLRSLFLLVRDSVEEESPQD